MYRHFLILILLVLFGFSGCSGCANSNTNNQDGVIYHLTGFTGSKNLLFAKVSLLDVNSKGQRGAINSTTLSNNKGYFRLQLPQKRLGRPMFLIAQKAANTEYRCELISGCYNGVNYQAGLSLDNQFELTAVVGEARDNIIVNINWLTHLASAYAYTTYITDDSDLSTTNKPKSGIYTPYTIELANQQVSKLFGLSDIISMPISRMANLGNISGSSKQQKIESLVAGAILAAAQQLAKDKNQSIKDWLNSMINSFLLQKGQLYEKAGSTHASLFAIYQAAEQVLTSNKAQQKSLSKPVASEVDDAIRELQQRQTVLRAGVLTQVKVASKYTKFISAMASSKTFLQDLNEQMLNFDGKDPSKKSFVTRDYVEVVKQHYIGLKDTYRTHLAAGINEDFVKLQALIAYFAGCIAGTCDASSAVHSGAVYNASNKTLSYSASGNRFNMSYKVRPRNEGDATSQIFDFTTKGSLSKISLEGDAYVRIRYDVSLPNVGKIGEAETGVQPVGFEFVWPEISVPKVDGNRMAFSFKGVLLGVKDGLNNNSKYHYNITQVDFYSKIGNGLTGTQTAMNPKNYDKFTALKFSARASGGGSFYPQNYWPKFSGFFNNNTNEVISQPTLSGLFTANSNSGFQQGDRETGLFQYRKGVERLTYAKKAQDVVYLDFWVKHQGANRTRLYDYVGRDGYYGMQTCKLKSTGSGDLSSTSWSVELCGDITNIKADKPTFVSLHQDGAFKKFSINGRGVYAPQYGTFAPTTSVQTVDGELEVPFTMGIENVKLQLEHELKNQPNAIVKFDLTQRVRDIWEAAVSFGYDYEYLIGVIPTGLKTKSLYASYLVKKNAAQNGDKVRIELGSLLIFVGKNALAGKHATSVQLASEVSFTEGSSHAACGLYQHGKLISKDDCSAIAYLTYRGALMATVREERPGIYVARYVDGSFVILGE